jgi:carbonic anhydrase
MRSLLLVAVLAGGCAERFSYVGDTGPAHWAKFSSVCVEGQRQSPVDLTGAVEKPGLAGVEFAYQAGPARALNNGHTIQVDTTGGSVTFGGETWTLSQFHFHHPAEHAIAGQKAPMELHLVHKGAHGLLVVGVMLVDGTGGAPFEPVFWQLPRHQGDTAAIASVDPTTFLPTDRGFFTYPGSLTVPPCSENVTWVLLKSPVTISHAQLEAFSALYPDDSRPLQPLNGRTIETPARPAQ